VCRLALKFEQWNNLIGQFICEVHKFGESYRAAAADAIVD